MGLIKSSLSMSIKASAQTNSYESMKAQQLADHTHAKNEEFFDKAARRFADLREQERAFSLTQPMSAGSSIPITSLSPVDLTNLATPAASSSSSSFDRRYIAPQQPQQMQQLMQKPAEMAAPRMFVRASETDPGTNDYDARAQFEQQMKLFGKVPSYKEVSYGVKVEHTGEMKASASGEKVPVTRLATLRQTPAVIEPTNFAPDWSATLERAMKARTNNNVRYLGRDVIRQTFVGSGYDV